jgi:hypothetical protein
MRDKTGSRTSCAKKKLDHFLEAALPGIYLPLYTMVTLTRIPYSKAARHAWLQEDCLRYLIGSDFVLLITVVRIFT